MGTDNSFYTTEELSKMGFMSLGKNVKISRYARIYDSAEIVIGNNVRVDDFCILSGKIEIGSYVHISAYTGVFSGVEGVIIEDFVTISSGCMLYSKSDDYSGTFMTGPMIPEKYTGVVQGQLLIKKFAIIGSGTRILPGVTIYEGASVGAMSLIKSNLDAWTIYAGIPVKKIRTREQGILEMKKRFYEEQGIDANE